MLGLGKSFFFYFRLFVNHVLSSPESDWKGKKGRVNVDLLNEVVGKNIANAYFCICGPKEFTEVSQE